MFACRARLSYNLSVTTAAVARLTLLPPPCGSEYPRGRCEQDCTYCAPRRFYTSTWDGAEVGAYSRWQAVFNTKTLSGEKGEALALGEKGRQGRLKHLRAGHPAQDTGASIKYASRTKSLGCSRGDSRDDSAESCLMWVVCFGFHLACAWLCV